MTTYRPAEAFPPGEFLREELEERGWSQLDFAAITGKDTRLISEVINGKRSITPETARVFAKALGTSAEVWLSLEAQYRLWLADADDNTNADIARRARLYTFPIREMSRRGWIDDAASLDVLEHQVMVFFSARSLDEVPYLEHAAMKRGTPELTPAQLAWLFRAKNLAGVLEARRYSERKLRAAVDQLRFLLDSPDKTREVPRVLEETGVRYVIVEGLSGLKIDGACFWLDVSSPVIAMSLRYDRIDNFWFVLRHEIEHVLRGDGKQEDIVDSDLERMAAAEEVCISEQERAANEAASDFCAPRTKLDEFVGRVAPYYKTAKITWFAAESRLHPGLVIGQLQARKELPYTHLRKFLVEVREFILETAVVDGWGITPKLKAPNSN